MELINGKEYPLWGKLVDRKDEFIGGILEEIQDSFPQMPGEAPQTKIVDITLEPNGEDSAMFHIVGEIYSCGFDVEHGGITAGEEGWLTFSGYGGHEFRIQKPQ